MANNNKINHGLVQKKSNKICKHFFL